MPKTVTIKFNKFTLSELLQFWLGLDHERQILTARGLTIMGSHVLIVCYSRILFILL